MKKDDKLAANSLTDEDIKAVVALSKDQRIGERVCTSVEFQVDVYMVGLLY